MAVEVTAGGLKIGGRDTPLVMGAMHYWRLDHLLWDDILEKVQGMGFDMIETYVPWSVHELAPGKFDFGDKDPRKDLGSFLDLCSRRGVYVLVRPGPHINSELTCFGYPERVLDDPECQSVSAQDTPVILPVPPKSFPVPSYSSGKFYDEVATWFDAVCPIIEKRIHPAGSVVAVQADNEMTNFFRTSAYDHDYSESAKRLFRDFLEDRYGEIAALNEAYRYQYHDFEDVPMLRRFDAKCKEDIPRYLDWAAYKEFYILNALKRITGMLRERGLDGIPVTHNYAGPHQACPFNVTETEKFLDIQGFDMYPTRKQYDQLKRGCLSSAAQSRLPFIPEFSSGAWINAPLIKLEDQQFTTPAAWMHGIKGISFYMLVERERWFGSPIARDGRIRQPRYDFYRKFMEVLKRYNMNSLKLESDILLVSARSYQYLDSASTLFEPLTPLFSRMAGSSAAFECSENPLDFEEPIPIAAEAWFEKWYKALRLAQYSFLIGDTAMDAGSLTGYKMLIAPTFEFLGKAEQEKLAGYASSGGVLVVGPRVPELDEKIFPCSIIKDMLKDGEAVEDLPGAKLYAVGGGKIIVVSSLPEKDAAIETAMDTLALAASVKRHFPALEPHVETSWHSNPAGGPGVLYVANPTDKKHTASIKIDQARKIRDVLTGREMGGEDILEFDMEPYSIRIMEVG